VQIEAKGSDSPEKRILDDLTEGTILSEANWENFKVTFEKIHPRFFTSLKEKAASITVAEQRMAALIKLNLNARQMATILGISVDSVHKAKQRLRQRMQVQNEGMLEETLAYL
jgi:DNA-binding CsgD family transcriptional regulator